MFRSSIALKPAPLSKYNQLLVHNNNNNNNNLLPSVFTRLHAVIISLVTLNLMTFITRLHLQSPRAFRD